MAQSAEKRVRARSASVITAVVVSVSVCVGLSACDDVSPGQRSSEPAKPEPSKSDPAKSEPAKSDPAKPEPTKVDPANPESGKQGSDPKAPVGNPPKSAGDGKTAGTEPAKPVDPAIEVNKDLPVTDATIGGMAFKLEVAATPRTREIGLMGRTSIPEGTGMIFVFPPSQFGVQSFWMDNCLTDMDILFLDNAGRILTMHTMTVPEPRKPEQSKTAYENSLKRYSSRYLTGVAIEIGPGMAKKLRLKEGDLVKLDIPGLKKQAK